MSPTTIPGNLIIQSPAANDPLLDLNTQPSLDLQFATSKTLDDRVSGQNLITFSRSTTGTYVDSNGIIQTAAIDAPRFDHDPTTNASLGLLVEESRTNLLTHSEELDNAAWTNLFIGVNDNSTTAPDGNLTADLLTRSANQQVVYQISPGANTYVFSVYAKAGSSNFVTLGSSVNYRGNAVTFNLSTGTPGNVVNYYSGADASITVSNPIMTDVGGGWWRCQINVNHTTGRAVHIEPGDLSNTAASAYLWGAQLEAGAFPTSYIPTSGSTVTRAADLASITGTNFSSWYNQSEGTMFIRDKVNPSASYSMAWVLQNTTNLNDGSVSNYLYTPSGSWILDSRNTGVNFDLSQSNVPGTFVKRAAGLKNGDLALALNGSISTSQTGTITASTSLLYIGQRPPSYFYNGHIARLTYYPYRLPDATLQEITS